MIKYSSRRPRNNTHLYPVKNVRTVHRIGLTTARLTISKDCTIVSVHYIIYSILTNQIEYLSLLNNRLYHMVKGEMEVIRVAVEVFFDFNCLVILMENYNFLITSLRTLNQFLL